VGCYDGSDDAAIFSANALTLSPGRSQDRREAPGSANGVSGRGILLCVDCVRNGRLSRGRRVSRGRDELPQLARAVPIMVGVTFVVAGVLQFTTWKAQHLASCRESPGPGHSLTAGVGTAWRHGLYLGFHCSCCCAGLVLILLVIGVMDLRTMAVVTVAVTAERLAPAGEHVARAIGAAIIAAGLFLIARAAGIG
jgi:Predicted metal-binding integral membrane protein (DUF2182)